MQVAIVGGGPAGLAAAIALAERGKAVQVLDAGAGSANGRAELLAQGASEIIARLGISDVLDGARRIDNVVSTWGQNRLQAHGGYPGLALHGWGVDRARLDGRLRQRCAALGVSARRARVARAEWGAPGWTLVLDSGASLTAEFVIDATGRAAHIARRHGAARLHGPALVALTWNTGRVDAPRMLAEAAPDGWWYHVPQPQGGTLGFMTAPDRARAILNAQDDFLARARADMRLVPVSAAIAPPLLIDARSAVLDQISGAGWLATGDAAASFDPIASQGLFNALSGGFFAGQAAADVVEGDGDAARIYAALAARTAERTHAATHFQYAALPYDTPFWRMRGLAQTDQTAGNKKMA